MKIVTVLGARPQFIKASMVSLEISRYQDIEEIIVHTGQHFDKNMSDIFFQQMGIKEPKYYLNINSTSHGAMTGKMLEEIEKVLLFELPYIVIVYGDTNSTLAGALAAKKLNIKVAHVEAGLRSYNMKMPEEINRVLTDRISDFLFCPTEQAVKNLKTEGYKNINTNIILSGDVMYDAALYYSKMAQKPDIKLPNEYILLTLHRQENTDNVENLKEIISAINEISQEIPIIFPIHPRTRKVLEKNQIKLSKNVFIVDPVGYLEMLFLLRNCTLVVTDSGGLQKEAYFFKKICLTLRNETEWIELVKAGVNFLCGSNKINIIKNYIKTNTINLFPAYEYTYGNGNARSIIGNIIHK